MSACEAQSISRFHCARASYRAKRRKALLRLGRGRHIKMPEPAQIVRIDAKTFQDALGEVAATMVQKVFREGRQHIAGPPYVGEDIATLIRYGASVYNLLNYLNADERRKEDCYWYVRYGVTGMSLVQSLIDCLYNVTAILEIRQKRAQTTARAG